MRDRLTAAILLVVLAPLFGVIALLLWLTQGRPVLFRQVRVGRGGREFEILKFRSMEPAGSGPEVTSGSDDRITPVGGVLRRSKLDELPQLWNILRGEMAFVGPRPEVPRYVAHYDEEQRAMLEAPPGLTDYTSLAFRHEEELLSLASNPERFYLEEVMPAKIRIFLETGGERSLRRDLRVLRDTFLVVVGAIPAPYEDTFALLREKARLSG